MTKTPGWMEATKEQEEQAKRVQHAVCAELNLLGREGLIPPVLIAGVGAAISDLITSVYGIEAVPKWFQDQADMLGDLAGRKH